MPAFDALLTQTMTVYPQTGHDRYGKPTFGAGVTVVCRFDSISRVKLTPTKQQIVIDAIGTVDPFVSIGVSDKVVGPDNKTYRLISTNNASDRFGDVHHIELEFQLWQI
jgi:hypothetical protein